MGHSIRPGTLPFKMMYSFFFGALLDFDIAKRQISDTDVILCATSPDIGALQVASLGGVDGRKILKPGRITAVCSCN